MLEQFNDMLIREKRVAHPRALYVKERYVWEQKLNINLEWPKCNTTFVIMPCYLLSVQMIVSWPFLVSDGQSSVIFA